MVRATWDWENGPIVFKKHKIDYSHSNQLTIYMFWDSFQDQFGQYKRFRKLLYTIHHKPIEEQKRVLQETQVNWAMYWLLV